MCWELIRVPVVPVKLYLFNFLLTLLCHHPLNVLQCKCWVWSGHLKFSIFLLKSLYSSDFHPRQSSLYHLTAYFLVNTVESSFPIQKRAWITLVAFRCLQNHEQNKNSMNRTRRFLTFLWANIPKSEYILGTFWQKTCVFILVHRWKENTYYCCRELFLNYTESKVECLCS